MSRVKFVMGIFFLLVLSGIAFSCTTTDDNFSVLNEEREATLNAETSKQQFANDVNAVMSEGKSLHNLSGNQVSQLQKSAIRMLKDEKVYSVDMDKLVEQNNAGIVFVGLMYLSLEKNTNNSNVLSSRSGTKTDDEEKVCFSYEKLQKCLFSCIVKTSTLDAIIRILNGYIEKGWAGCVTKAIVREILRKVANKLVGFGVAYTVEMVVCVWDCMDFDFQF